jgi:hypothetical protein
MTEPYQELGGRPSNTPLPERARGCGKPPYLCNHPDAHQCPFLDQLTPEGKAIPCGCTHIPETPKKSRGK